MNDKSFLKQLGIFLFICRALARNWILHLWGQWGVKRRNASNTGVLVKSWTPYSQQHNSHWHQVVHDPAMLSTAEEIWLLLMEKGLPLPSLSPQESNFLILFVLIRAQMWVEGEAPFLLCSLLLLFYFNRVEGKYPLMSLHSALWACLDYAVCLSHNFSFAQAQVLSKCRNF